MNTVSKGDDLEHKFYHYLAEQQSGDSAVYGLYPPNNCKIYRQKKYYDPMREADVTFDIVIEVFRDGSFTPHLFVIFECKNYSNSVPEIQVNDFSSKLSRIFPHRAKGVIVTASPLQSGAEKIAQKTGMGIVKFSDDGFEVVADRKENPLAEEKYISPQIFGGQNLDKKLKFSAFYNGFYFGTVREFLDGIHSEGKSTEINSPSRGVPYVSLGEIDNSAKKIWGQCSYSGGAVNLYKICEILSLSVILNYGNDNYENQSDADGRVILGQANFKRKSISLNFHGDKNRERFTLAHEIGHFCLGHGDYLHSDLILERDLIIGTDCRPVFNYERLEMQANFFASALLLPEDFFLEDVKHRIADLNLGNNLRGRGRPYIFVDDQPCNFRPYNQLLSELSKHFGVSRTAAEIKLKALDLLTDARTRPDAPRNIGQFLTF